MDTLPRRGHAIAVTENTRAQFRSKEWWSPTLGVRLPATERGLTSRCDAVLLAVPRAVISGATAAVLWGLPVPKSTTDLIEITVARGAPEVRRPGVRCRRRDLPPIFVLHSGGRALLSPAQLFVDLGAELALPWLVAFGDAAYRQQLMDESAVVRALAKSTGHRGIRRAREALALLDARAESPRESIVRAMLANAGLPRAVPQFEVCTSDGAFVARLDLAIVEHRIAIEYDGEYHLSPQRQAADAIRRQKLQMLGWWVVTLNREDAHDARRLTDRVSAAIRSRTSPP
jgi:hypothetical protein